jgi:hypothetical protein
MVIKFDFFDPYPILVQVKQELTREQLNEIEDAIQSYIEENEHWDANEQFIDTIMSSFPYEWEVLGIDYTFFI